MTINTITCHDVYNYGASLQAYALMKCLRNEGHQVKIIDYKPNYLSGHYNVFAISEKYSSISTLHRLAYYCVRIPYRLCFWDFKRKRAFDQFKSKHLHLTDIQYHNNEELKNAPPIADLYIAGSDQIWNTAYPNGKDPAFYLDFAPNGKIRASYAASFSVSEIDDKIKSFVRQQISKLDFVSVRESTGLQILASIGLSGCQVCDPVFLLAKNEWSAMTHSRMIRQKYILVYDFELNKDIENFVKKYAKKYDLKIVSIKDGPNLEYADKVIKGAGPLDFLTLIRDCECVVSNSFHGSAFALIFNKEFYVFNRMRQKVNSRMVDLLAGLHLEERLITNKNDTFLSKINYKEVNPLMEAQVRVAYEYLHNIMK